MADAAGLFSRKLHGRSVGIVPLSPVPRRPGLPAVKPAVET
jgi:hypothetical protein